MKIKKVLVSQPKPASEKSPYYDIAEKYGVKIDFRPFIKVESLSAKEFRQQKVSILDHTAVIFTSRHAIDHFFNLCTELRVTIPETMKYFCVTEAVALYIQKYVQYRKRKIFFGATGKIEDLVPSIVKHKTEKYLVPMSDVHNDDVKNLLDKNNIQHTEAVMYRTVFDLNLTNLVIIGLIILIFTKILMFYKWVKLFFHQLSAAFLLILYFCALEIIPCLLLYQGMIQVNNVLLIKI